MTRSRRSFALPTTFILVIAASLVGRASGPADSVRITAAANVTLRATPSASAQAVAQLPLGTEVTNSGPAGLDKTWIRVKLSDNREGWLLASLTKPLDPAWRWPTFDRIIADRLGRKGDGFQASAELAAFIDRVAPEYTDPDGRARLELSRLRAMSSALAAIPPNGGRRDPYASWLTSRKGDVTFDEPGNRWMLSESAIWERHARLASSPVADDVAWFAVTNGLSGECEGRLPCYLNARNRLEGEYLRRQPTGQHVTEAVDTIKGTSDLLGAPSTSQASYAFDATRDCRDFTSTLDALTAAVKSTRVTNRDATIASLAALRKACQ